MFLGTRRFDRLLMFTEDFRKREFRALWQFRVVDGVVCPSAREVPSPFSWMHG